MQLAGHPEVNAIHARLVREAFADRTDAIFRETHWQRGEPREKSGGGGPSVLALQMANWHGGRGARREGEPRPAGVLSVVARAARGREGGVSALPVRCRLICRSSSAPIASGTTR